jgi:hypothetical protein
MLIHSKQSVNASQPLGRATGALWGGGKSLCEAALSSNKLDKDVDAVALPCVTDAAIHHHCDCDPLPSSNVLQVHHSTVPSYWTPAPDRIRQIPYKELWSTMAKAGGAKPCNRASQSQTPGVGP